jgi:hypothetical protein
MNAQALALVNAESFDGGNVNAQALALVNAQALALVNGSSDFVANAQALALVNAQALALVNAQALALVNAQALALVNAQALALVNLYPNTTIEELDEIQFATVNAQALALVNAQALALVNLYPGMEMGELNAQALALVNAQALALVNTQALALVNNQDLELSLANAQALALVNLYPDSDLTQLNAQALALVNAQALALVNAQALALVNAQALALVNEDLTLESLQLNAQALALVNAQALALVNAQALALVNAQALALVNAQALALVNLYPGMTMDQLNAQALALVNAQALALVNAQALALVNQSEGQVNSASFSDVYNNNEDAVILLTVADIEAMRVNNNSIELLSVNIISGNTVTGNGETHKIAPGAFMAKNFNVNYGLGNLSVDPAPIDFSLADDVVTYDGKTHEIVVTPTYKERFDKNGNPYVIIPTTPPYAVSYLDEVGNTLDSIPTNAGIYTVNISITDFNYMFVNNNAPAATLTIEPAPVSFTFSDTTQTYNGSSLFAAVNPTVILGTASTPVEGADFALTYDGNVTQPINVGSYAIGAAISNTNYVVDSYIPESPFLTIEPAPVTFEFSDNTQTYNGSSLFVAVSPTVTVGSAIAPVEGTDFIVTYDGTTTQPINVGSFIVDVVLSNTNYVVDSYVPESPTLTVEPAPVTFEFSNSTQTYNGTSLFVAVSATVTLGSATAPVDGTDYKVTYDGATAQPINVGSYTVDVVLSNTNYMIESYVPELPILTIEPAPVTFEFSNTTKTYNGSSLFVAVSANVTVGTASTPVEGTDYYVTYDGSEIQPINVGSYAVDVLLSNTNYMVDSYVPELPVLTIEPAPVTFEITNTIQTYDGSSLFVIVSPAVTVGSAASPVQGTDFNVTYNGATTQPTNVGSYTIGVLLSNTNYVINSFVPALPVLTIEPAYVSFEFTNTLLTYNGFPQIVTVNATPLGITYEVEYYNNGNIINPPTNAGEYMVEAVVNNDNYIVDPATASSSFTINKALLEINGDSKAINDGAVIPEFIFTYNGFLGLDDANTVFGVNGSAYTLAYNQNSGPGEYPLDFTQTISTNYFVTTNGIYLYVNPDKPGTKAIVPSLDCVTVDNNGIYTAIFSYKNRNNSPVWVMIGPDNMVSGGGENKNVSQQPIKFEPGTGEWNATFDGSPMTWTVSSQNHGPKTSQAQIASSNSKNCNTTKAGEQNLDEDITSGIPSIYPNPVKEKLTILIAKQNNIDDVVRLFNILGKEKIVNINRVSDQKVELDMSNLSPGIYMVQVRYNNKMNVFQVIKQ